MTIRQKLEYIKGKGIMMKSVAAVADIDPSTIYHYLAGDTQELEAGTAASIEAAITVIVESLKVVLV